MVLLLTSPVAMEENPPEVNDMLVNYAGSYCCANLLADSDSNQFSSRCRRPGC